MLYDVRLDGEAGRPRGFCIRRGYIVNPDEGTLGQTVHDFLRLLHGIDVPGPTNATIRLLDDASATERLLRFACEACNDYAKLDGVGKARANDIALSWQSTPPELPDTIVKEGLRQWRGDLS